LFLDASAKIAVNALKEAGRRNRMKDDISRFCSETSFTAVVRIYHASSWMTRVGWLIVVLGMLVYMFVQVCPYAWRCQTKELDFLVFFFFSRWTS
jgi:hypothetical protein